MELLFPHEKPREHQSELMNEVLEALKSKRNILIHAPTGLGKTASTLVPALTYALDKKQTIFFLTSRHTQHKIAIETLKKIKEKFNLDFKVTDLIGKKNLCLQSSVNELKSSDFADYCKDQIEKNLCEFYENSKSKVKTNYLLKQINSIIDIKEVKELCNENKLCPFEISCMHAKTSKVIICDYNHVLNPSIRETLFLKTYKTLENSIIIIDESHNLPSRSRNLLTSQISTFTIKQALKEVPESMKEELQKINDFLEKQAKKIPITENEKLVQKGELMNEIKDYEGLIGSLTEASEIILEEKKKSYAKSLAEFLKAWKGQDEAFARILKRNFDKKGKVIINLIYRCLDPSLILKPLSEKAHSLILMSGTLLPLEMYRDLFSINGKCLEYKNPFPRKNKLNLIIPGISTKYTLRTPEMYKKIAEKCSDIVNSVPGNSIIFFPSYKLRDEINEYLQLEKTTLFEKRDLTKNEKFEILEKFETYKNSGCVLLAVSSGNFGESIDLLGDLLKCVVIVGLPLVQPDLEIKELIKYYNLKFGKGWDYGYILPAIIKSFQNAGRCIRSEKDKGIIAFLDERYTWNNYFRSFPKDENIKITKEPVKYINEFFG